MGILTIQPVTRNGMRLLISLYGMSETGKTLSALKLAAGIEPDPKKRMLLDTEGGKRGKAYMDKIDGGYLYGDLTPPFSPDRYVEALNEIEAAGVNVLVIDSVSHAWFAEGGILDMVEESTVKNDLGKWIIPKRRLRKMTNRLLSSDMHIILCSRGKQPLIEEEQPGGGKKKLVPGPVVPIQEKTLRFDMTVMALMLGDGRFKVSAPEGKCPGDLRPIFAAGEVMNEDMGRKLAAWIGGADVRTPEQRRLEIDATAAASGGTQGFREFWSKRSRVERDMLAARLGNYQSIAKAADEEAERERRAESDRATDLADPFGGKANGVPADEAAEVEALRKRRAADSAADFPGDRPAREVA